MESQSGTIKILDVRTHGEYVFVGHAPMAFNIPYLLLTTQWNTSTKSYIMEPNPGFVSDVEKKFALQDTILVMCRSGGRSASSVNILAEEGFKNVYSIIDGFEGDVVDDSESYFNEKRFKNGWKNSGAPWTYELNSDVVYK